MTNKLKVKAMVAVFNDEIEAHNFVCTVLETHYKYDTFVNSEVQLIDGKYKATVIVSNPYDAAEAVLMSKPLADVQAIAKNHGVKITGGTLVNTTLNRQDVEKMLERGEINDNFIKHNLNGLFDKGATKWRKQVFSNHGIELKTQKIKHSTLNKRRLVTRLLQEASTFNYDNYAYEVAFLVNK